MEEIRDEFMMKWEQQEEEKQKKEEGFKVQIARLSS